MSNPKVSAAFTSALAAGEKAVLATLVRTSGSTYRKAGASMLVRENGDTIGLLSGGCLERDIAAAAAKLTDQQKLLHFDLTPDDDYLVGYGKGCAGQMWVLLEPIRGNLMQAQLAPKCATANALIIESGERLIIDADGSIHTDICNSPDFIQTIVNTLRARNSVSKPFFEESQTTQGHRTAWCGWYNRPTIDLVIFGAGLDSIPVYALATALNWRVRICDHRPSMLRWDKFPLAEALITITRDHIPNLDIGPSTHVVIMSHDLLVDAKALIWSAERPEIPYIGLLGPRQRFDRVISILKRDGLDCSSRLSSRLRSPIGLDIGGNTESDIALAIVAQIQRDWHQASAKDMSQVLAP